MYHRQYRNTHYKFSTGASWNSFVNYFVGIRNVFKELKVTHRQNEGRMGGILLLKEQGDINNRTVKINQYFGGDKIE